MYRVKEKAQGDGKCKYEEKCPGEGKLQVEGKCTE